jgi:hypothetical protein
MFTKAVLALTLRLAQATRRPDRGLETLEFVLWAAGILAVIAALIVLVGNKLNAFWNGIDFGSVG